MALARIIGQGIVVVAAALACGTTAGEILLVDDAGRSVRIAAPARRIVSLAPGTTELLFAAGAGPYLVGTVEHSNHPEAARHLPRVGSAMQIDPERIASLKADLVVAWPHGAARHQARQLDQLRIPLWISDPRTVAALPDAIQTFGTLAGTQSVAEPAAARLRADLLALREAQSRRAPLAVFVQIGDRPLMTVNGKHLLSDALGYCGARNVFAAAPALVPTVDREGVLAAAPDVILLVADAADERAWADAWRSWNRRTGGGPGIAVASAGRLASFSPRVLEGLRDMCAELQRHRRS